jgi:hypothetical protein
MKPAKFHDQEIQRMWDQGVTHYNQRKQEAADKPYVWKFPLFIATVPYFMVYLAMRYGGLWDMWVSEVSLDSLLLASIVPLAMFLTIFRMLNEHRR